MNMDMRRLMMERREDTENSQLIIAPGDILQKLRSLHIPSRNSSHWAHTLTVNNLLLTTNEVIQTFLYVQLASTLANKIMHIY